NAKDVDRRILEELAGPCLMTSAANLRPPVSCNPATGLPTADRQATEHSTAIEKVQRRGG
ncbi:MAG: hypothetical protein VB835_15615, partial [Pirellulales bacterium]